MRKIASSLLTRSTPFITLSRCAPAFPSQIQIRQKTNSSWRKRAGKTPPRRPKVVVEDNRPVEEIVSNIDTTLTPRQRQHVEHLKRQYKGANSPRCNDML